MLKDQGKKRETGAETKSPDVKIRTGGKAMSFLERNQEMLQRMELRRRPNFTFFHGISNKYIHAAQSEDIELGSKLEDLETSNGLRRKLETYNFGGLIGAKIQVGFKPDNFYSKPTANEEIQFLNEIKSPDFIHEAKSPVHEAKSPVSSGGSGTKIDVFLEHNTLMSGVDVLRRQASTQQKGTAFLLNHKSLPLKEPSKTGFLLSQNSLPLKEPFKDIVTLFREYSNHKDPEVPDVLGGIESCSIACSLPQPPLPHEYPQVLIVDDDAFNLFSLETLFRMFDFRCRKATNGREAVDFLLNQQKCSFCIGIRLL